MAYDLTKPLVIGISSRALFDLEVENRIYETEGAERFAAYQREHEERTLSPGPAFHLAEAFLRLNRLQEQRLVEVIIMSRNSPDASLRVFKSIQHYGLDITRAALVSGAVMTPYLKAFHTDLFLSANAPDVKLAVDSGIAAGRIVTRTARSTSEVDQIRIAFDGDAVLFSSEAERIFQQQGLDAFQAHELAHADRPLPMGPFANFLKTLSHLQGLFPREQAPIRTALVTARSVPAHERAIKTLRDWNIRVDEAFFLGGVRKREILSAFGAHIFFDDQEAHTDPASDVVASAVVPYREGDDPNV